MRHLDLFSGIGGFALAASWVWPDHEAVAFCEREPFAQKVLAKHWPGVPCVEDIHNLKGDEFGTVDLITGGFPCQPFSLAGKRKGSDDDRALWPEMCRVIQEARPTWVIGENVSGIIGVELDKVLSDLEGAGYEQQTFVVPACAKDAQHRRDRVWVVAHAEQSRTRDKDREVAMQRREPPAKRTKTLRQGNRAALSNWADATGEAVAHPNGLRVERPWPKQQATGFSGKGENVPHTEGKRLQRERDAEQRKQGELAGCHDGFCKEWAPEPGVGRVAHGAPRELDLYRGMINEQSNNQEANTETLRVVGWKVLRRMWELRWIAKTSPELYAQQLCDLMPKMSYEGAHGGWFLGAWIEKSKTLRDLWERFYSKPFQEAQDLQQELFERIGEVERTKKVGPVKDRVDRIKGLGNAIVPQVAMQFMQFIKIIEQEHGRNVPELARNE